MSVIEQSTTVGSSAPDLSLPDHSGVAVSLSSFWKKQPLALVFARHLGCPFCRSHLMELKQEYSQYQTAGCEIVAVTMSPPQDTATFRDKFQIPFPMLSDVDQKAYQAFTVRRGGLNSIAGPGLWWQGMKSLFAFGSGKVVGDPFQLPGSFVISQEGIIRFAHFSRDSAEWASTADHLMALR
jgi:peroxiredoxin